MTGRVTFQARAVLWAHAGMSIEDSPRRRAHLTVWWLPVRVPIPLWAAELLWRRA